MPTKDDLINASISVVEGGLNERFFKGMAESMDVDYYSFLVRVMGRNLRREYGNEKEKAHIEASEYYLSQCEDNIDVDRVVRILENCRAQIDDFWESVDLNKPMDCFKIVSQLDDISMFFESLNEGGYPSIQEYIDAWIKVTLLRVEGLARSDARGGQMGRDRNFPSIMPYLDKDMLLERGGRRSRSGHSPVQRQEADRIPEAWTPESLRPPDETHRVDISTFPTGHASQKGDSIVRQIGEIPEGMKVVFEHGSPLYNLIPEARNGKAFYIRYELPDPAAVGQGEEDQKEGFAVAMHKRTIEDPEAVTETVNEEMSAHVAEHVLGKLEKDDVDILIEIEQGGQSIQVLVTL